MLAFSFAASATLGCAGFPDAAPQTRVVLDNRYQATAKDAFVIYDALWSNASFSGQAISPGASSTPEDTVPASPDNTAYVVLAPGWDGSSDTPPTTFVLLQSTRGYGVALGGTLHISVDDVGFEGNCAAGSHLTQTEADFLTQVAFPDDFAGLHYDASTCTTTQIGDSGAP